MHIHFQWAVVIGLTAATSSSDVGIPPIPGGEKPLDDGHVPMCETSTKHQACLSWA